MSKECNSIDRSGDPIAPSHPGITNHVALCPDIVCPACSRPGRSRENSWGKSPPHGWWVAKDGMFYCSSECIAYAQRTMGRR